MFTLLDILVDKLMTTEQRMAMTTVYSSYSYITNTYSIPPLTECVAYLVLLRGGRLVSIYPVNEWLTL